DVDRISHYRNVLFRNTSLAQLYRPPSRVDNIHVRRTGQPHLGFLYRAEQSRSCPTSLSFLVKPVSPPNHGFASQFKEKKENQIGDELQFVAYDDSAVIAKKDLL